MKKFFLIGIIFFIYISNSYAEGDCSSCSIKDAPAEVLQNYIENQRKVISRITSKASGKKDNMSLKEIELKFNEINSIIDFDTYYDDFKYILLELFTSVPKEIRRDKVKLENELTHLQNYIERSIKRGYSGVGVSKDDICDGIENCNLSGSVLEVFTALAKNNTEILTLYKNSIIGQNKKKADFIIVPDTFYDELITSYNKNTLMDCSSCEGGFFQKISEKVDNIAKNMKTAGDATKYWKDAWNLLTGNVSDADLKKLEKDLLVKELAKQGLSKEQSKIILDNLDKFYEKSGGGGYSTENNFISNSILSITNAIGKYIDSFSDVLSNLTEDDFEDGKIVINKIRIEAEKKDSTQEMYISMQKIYASLIKEASMQSIVDEKSIDKLLSIHATISKIISNLEKTVKPAQTVCKDQCAGVGNCTDY